MNPIFEEDFYRNEKPRVTLLLNLIGRFFNTTDWLRKAVVKSEINRIDKMLDAIKNKSVT